MRLEIRYKNMFRRLIYITLILSYQPTFGQVPISTTSDTVELTSLKHWPRPAKQVSPVYPELARQDKVEAEVMLSVLIGKDGKPKKIKVMNIKTSFMKVPSVKSTDSLPNPKYAKLFRQPSIDAVMKWQFTKPLKPDSTTALVWVNVPLRYQLTLQK